MEVPHGRVGFCLTLTHGARGRGVGLDLDRHSQVEKGGVSFDHRVPEDQRALLSWRAGVGLGGPFCTHLVITIVSLSLFVQGGAWIPPRRRRRGHF